MDTKSVHPDPDKPSVRANVPIKLHGDVQAHFVSFHGLSDTLEHVAVVIGNADQQDIPLVRVHSQCLSGDVFHSTRCDCGDQLNEAIAQMKDSGGVILYLIQEGRGIGLYNKLDAYRLQIEQGIDTFEANHRIGMPMDARDYKVASEMLKAMGFNKIRLLSNNPDKESQLCSYGIEIIERVPTEVYVKDENLHYLQAKRDKSGHDLNLNTAEREKEDQELS